jgi:hypothetical protein
MTDTPKYAFLRIPHATYPEARAYETLVAYDKVVAIIPNVADDNMGGGIPRVTGSAIRTSDGKTINVPFETPEQIITRMLSALHRHEHGLGEESEPPVPTPITRVAAVVAPDARNGQTAETPGYYTGQPITGPGLLGPGL